MGRNEINIECDATTGEYFIIWQPIIIGAGKTAREALEDLKTAAHCGTDTLIEVKKGAL